MPLRIQAGSRIGGPGVLASRRRAFQLTLGVIWLLDAALQFQPSMFTRAFVRDAILPVAAGNPAVVARPIIWSAHLMLGHIVIVNAAFATLQLLLALGLFWRPAVKVALAASIAWSLAVWWLGEGLGGLLAGSLDPFAGAPGAVLLYVFVALLVWPPRDDGLVGGRWLAARLWWVVLWASLACAAMLPATLAGHGALIAIVLAVLCGVAASTAGAGRLARIGVVAAAAAGVVIWTAQGFGEILTGQATDPNSGLLLLVIAAAFWPCRSAAAGGEGRVAHCSADAQPRLVQPALERGLAHASDVGGVLGGKPFDVAQHDGGPQFRR